MKLYYAPGACSLAPHIVINEAKINATLERVDLREKKTETGRDYRSINPMGAVPALELDNGELLTENAVLMQYLAAQAPNAGLIPAEGMPRWRLLETLNFITTELHKGFGPLFKNPPAEWREVVIQNLKGRFALLEQRLGDKPYLGGDHFSIADAYAFVILLWARNFKIDVSEKLNAYAQRVASRPAVQQTLKEEGLPTA